MQDDGDGVLRGAAPTDTIWINRVPEPRTVKQRVHVDVTATSIDAVVALGATVAWPAEESGLDWTLMTDPEGGELCLFLRPDQPSSPAARPYALVVDAADSTESKAMAEWWASILGGRSADKGRGWWWVEGAPGMPFATFDFVPVPEPKSVKNRIHWDVTSSDLPGVLAAGATVLAEPTPDIRWHVLADPAGNEFCLFAPS
jgi:predicted enzyme related to lactoylglutathione lyase